MLDNWKAKLAVLLAGGYGGIKENILKPLLGRVGSMVTGYLVGLGAPEEQSQLVAVGVSALGLILFDLLISWMNRKSAQRKAVNKLLADSGVGLR